MRRLIISILKNENNNVLFIALLSLIFTFGLITVDVAIELKHKLSFEHIIVELLIFLTSLTGMVSLVYKFQIERKEKHDLLDRLNIVNKEMDDWKAKVAKVSKDFFAAIDEQMEKWGLSKSEKDIAVLLVKGMSTKDIAELRGVTEKTIRTHATSIYRKSNLNTRYELASYFIEGLF